MDSQNVVYNMLQNHVPRIQEAIPHAQRYLLKSPQQKIAIFYLFIACLCNLQLSLIQIHAFYLLVHYSSESLSISKYHHAPFKAGTQ